MWRDDSAVRHDSNPDWGCVLDPKQVQNVLAAQAFPQQSYIFVTEHWFTLMMNWENNYWGLISYKEIT